jgi:hypothetical protein
MLMNREKTLPLFALLLAVSLTARAADPAVSIPASNAAFAQQGAELTQQPKPSGEGSLGEKPMHDFEATNLTVTRTFQFQSGNGSAQTVAVQVPVYFHAGSVYLTPERLNELADLQKQIDKLTQQSEELRTAAAQLVERYQQLLRSSIPVDVLTPNSFSIPSGPAAAPASSVITKIPQSEVVVQPEQKK